MRRGLSLSWSDVLVPMSLRVFPWMALILAATTAAGAVARDLRAGAFEFYFSRPVRPVDYRARQGGRLRRWCWPRRRWLAGPLLLSLFRVGLSRDLDEVIATLGMVPRACCWSGWLASLAYAVVPLAFSSLSTAAADHDGDVGGVLSPLRRKTGRGAGAFAHARARRGGDQPAARGGGASRSAFIQVTVPGLQSRVTPSIAASYGSLLAYSGGGARRCSTCASSRPSAPAWGVADGLRRPAVGGPAVRGPALRGPDRARLLQVVRTRARRLGGELDGARRGGRPARAQRRRQVDAHEAHRRPACGRPAARWQVFGQSAGRLAGGAAADRLLPRAREPVRRADRAGVGDLHGRAVRGAARAERAGRGGARAGRDGAARTRSSGRVRGFSKGMRQRTKLAQCLAHDPALLILDEPLDRRGPDRALGDRRADPPGRRAAARR